MTRKSTLTFVSFCNIKETAKSQPLAHWLSLMPPEDKVFISNSPWRSKYHLTLNFFLLLWQSHFLSVHILLNKHFLFQQNTIIQGNTSMSLPMLQALYQSWKMQSLAMKGFILPVVNILPFSS